MEYEDWEISLSELRHFVGMAWVAHTFNSVPVFDLYPTPADYEPEVRFRREIGRIVRLAAWPVTSEVWA